MGNYYYLASWATGTAGAGFLGDHAEVAVAALATSSVYLLAYVRTWQRSNILSWHFYLAAHECQVIQITFAMSDSGEPILSSVRPGSLAAWKPGLGLISSLTTLMLIHSQLTLFATAKPSF